MISRILALLTCFALVSACGGSGGGSSPPPPPPPPPPPANFAPTVDAGADVTIQLPVDSVVLDATVSDDGLPSGSTVTTVWSVQSGPAGATFDDETAEDPTVTFGGAGTYVLELTASDSELEGSDTVQIIVQAVDGGSAPVADDQAVSTAEDTALPITLTATDADGDALTYAIEAQPANGTLSGTPPAVTYTPGADFNGDDSFTFTASDGALSSNVATVTVTVSAVNDAPIVTINAPADNSNFDVGATISFQASATDVEDDDATLTAAIEWSSDVDGALGTGGTLDISTLSAGVHVVTASVTDSGAETASATVNVTVADLSAYWTFDEGAGTVAADFAGDNDATITDAVHVAGVSGTALDFTDVDARVVVDDPAALDITGTEISLVAWINPRNGGKSNFSRIISKRVALSAGGLDVFAMMLDDYRLVFRLDGGADVGGQDMTSTHIVRLDDWTHVAMVYDSTDMRIYVNGELDATTPVAKADPVDSSSREVHIGLREKATYDGTDDGRDFVGLIDEVQVLGRALSAQEVSDSYTAFTPPAPTGLFFEDISDQLGRTDPDEDLGSHAVAFAEVNDDNVDDYILARAVEGLARREYYYQRSFNQYPERAGSAGLRDDLDDDGSYGATWADLDNDGDYDLVNASTFAEGNPTPGNPAPNNVYQNDGTGVFVDVTDPDITATAIESRGVAAFDMDADGDLDLYSIAGPDDPGVKEAYRNDGGFAFTPHAGGDLTSASVPTVWGLTDTDYDGDGDIDILTGNRGTAAGFDDQFTILQNDGAGTFSRVLPSALGIADAVGDREIAQSGVTTADYDNDGDLDMLLLSPNTANLWRNDGGTYTHVQTFFGTEGYSGAFADLDNDGDLDLVFAGDEKIYRNDGSGTFRFGPSVPVGGIAAPRSIAFSDIDNDGDLDFAISAKESGSWLVRNEQDFANNYLKVQLTAANGQAGAFGAKTFVYPSGQGGTHPNPAALVGMRESRSNQGYVSQDSPVLHFGLGSIDTTVDVVVEYVDGTQRTCTGVSVNARKRINETAADPCNP